MLHSFHGISLPALIQAYGLWVVFAVVTIESMGVPLPGETALVAAAIYAGSTHKLSIIAVIAAAAAGATVGGVLGYAIGRSLGHRVLVRYGTYVRLTGARLKVGQYLFLRHGGKIIFFGRFVAFLRAFASLLAGANRMSWPRFLAMNALGGACWALIFGGAAFVFGDEMKRVAGPMSILLAAVVVSLVVAGVVFFRRHEKELEERAEVALPGPMIL